MGGEKAIAPHPAIVHLRITPAWAGKSIRASRCSFGIEDHPRVGGEKDIAPVSPIGVSGSPPHGRGKNHGVAVAEGVEGITPAWAGKSRRCCLPGSPRRDHPRMGGEKPARRRAFKRPTGSPPRGRGKVLAALMPENRLGITPAWAGKRCSFQEQKVRRGDHPRVGGEKHPSP